jgi:hypothetical protein
VASAVVLATAAGDAEYLIMGGHMVKLVSAG